MTRKYRLERTAFIGCRNTAYMDVDDAETQTADGIEKDLRKKSDR